MLITSSYLPYLKNLFQRNHLFSLLITALVKGSSLIQSETLLDLPIFLKGLTESKQEQTIRNLVFKHLLLPQILFELTVESFLNTYEPHF